MNCHASMNEVGNIWPQNSRIPVCTVYRGATLLVYSVDRVERSTFRLYCTEDPKYYVRVPIGQGSWC